MARYAYDLQGCLEYKAWLVLVLKIACPPWDCLGLLMDTLLAVPWDRDKGLDWWLVNG